jgi:cellulase/cellobiase CelA1
VRIRAGARFQSGFSIIDALIGLMLLGIVIAGFLTVLRHATMGTASNTTRTQATFIVQEVLEKIKALDNSANTVSNFETQLGTLIPTSVTRENLTYNVGVNILPNTGITGPLANALIPVQVRVSWTENGAAKELRMVNYYYTKSTPLPAANPVVTATVKPTPTTNGFVVEYTINQWNNGATVNVTIYNYSKAQVNGWVLTWNFTNVNQKITNLWNGSLNQSGKEVTVTNVGYNKVIAVDAFVNFGFELSCSGTDNPKPATFSLNGMTCAVK